MTTLDLPVDTTFTYVLLNPTQASILAAYCSMYGPEPPPGVYRATWRQILHARATGVSCREFAALVDGLGYGLLEALRGAEGVG